MRVQNFKGLHPKTKVVLVLLCAVESQGAEPPFRSEVLQPEIAQSVRNIPHTINLISMDLELAVGLRAYVLLRTRLGL